MLFVVFLVTVIRLSLFFLMKSSNRLIDVSTLSLMLVSPFPPSFLKIYSLSMSSLGWMALCIVISFIVLWSIFKVLPTTTLRMVPSILQGLNEVFIRLMSFQLYSLVSSCFLVLLKHTSIIFFFHFRLIVSASNFPKYLKISFSPSVLIFFLIW